MTGCPAGPPQDLCAGPVCSCLKHRKRPHPHPRSASRSLSLPPALCQSPGKTGKTWPSPQRGGNDLFACCQLHTRHVPTEVLNGIESGAGHDNGQPKRHGQGHPSGRMERKDRRFAVQSLFPSGGAGSLFPLVLRAGPGSLQPGRQENITVCRQSSAIADGFGVFCNVK